jgi:hypothetical protein
MKLTRLQQLAEAPQHPADAAAGVRAVVEDALADLHDKLGPGGSLAQLLKDAGLSRKDSIPDADGKTIMERLAIRTKQYAEEVERLLTEAELMLATAADRRVTEGRVPGAEEQRTRRVTDRLVDLAEQLHAAASGAVLAKIIADRGFPETETKAMREAAKNALGEAEDLQRGLLAGYDMEHDD